MGLKVRALQAPNKLPMKPKIYAKASKRSAGGMVYRPTSKVTAPLKIYWSPPSTRTLWPKSGAIYWF